MDKRSIGRLAAALLVLMMGAAVWERRAGDVHAAQALDSVPTDPKSISGVVKNGSKPEAGVWVMAETHSLPTFFRRIVVTDEQGRFLVPDLPAGSYELWVRGYGLQDSPRVKAELGQRVELPVTSAANPRDAARIYPSNYWFALYQAPPKEQLPSLFESQVEWLGEMKTDCFLCHQLGNADMRRFTQADQWKNAWKRSVVMGHVANFLGTDALAASLSEWATKIANGAVPPVAPPRPSGAERNFVVTQWEWAPPDINIHDEISTDKRNPYLYPYGKVYGGVTPQAHNPMLDDKGMLWLTAVPGVKVYALDPTTNKASLFEYNGVPPKSRPIAGGAAASSDRGGTKGEQPVWAPDAVQTPIALSPAEKKKVAETLFVQGGANQLVVFDTKTEKYTYIDTIFATHHLQLDKQGRLWTSGMQANVLGQFLTKEFDPQRVDATNPIAQKPWVDVDPKTKEPVTGGGGYGIIVNPVDGTVWRAHPAIFSGSAFSGYEDLPDKPAASGFVSTARNGNKISKFDPRTGKFKYYPLPAPGVGPKGMDATTDGMIWFGTASGHLGRFNPKTEKFTFWEAPGPKLAGMGKETGAADYFYYIWADQFDTLGFGKDKVILTGTTSDALLIFDPKTERFTIVRVPYPLTFYHRGLDGRIDDPKAGWKGRGLWANYSNLPPRHIEDRKNYLNHIQYRPDPLAR